jgi:hypothetical protein
MGSSVSSSVSDETSESSRIHKRLENTDGYMMTIPILGGKWDTLYDEPGKSSGKKISDPPKKSGKRVNFEVTQEVVEKNKVYLVPEDKSGVEFEKYDLMAHVFYLHIETWLRTWTRYLNSNSNFDGIAEDSWRLISIPVSYACRKGGNFSENLILSTLSSPIMSNLYDHMDGINLSSTYTGKLEVLYTLEYRPRRITFFVKFCFYQLSN